MNDYQELISEIDALAFDLTEDYTESMMIIDDALHQTDYKKMRKQLLSAVKRQAELVNRVENIIMLLDACMPSVGKQEFVTELLGELE